MTITFIRDWRRYKRGDVITGDDGFCNVLVRRGIAAEAATAVKTAVKPKQRNQAKR